MFEFCTGLMYSFLPTSIKKWCISTTEHVRSVIQKVLVWKKYHRRQSHYIEAILLGLLCLFLITTQVPQKYQLISPISSSQPLIPLEPNKKSGGEHEVFGFAPYWTFDKLSNVDFNTLTTFAYFGIDVYGDGTLATDGPGYTTFYSDKATNIFKKAHTHGTRVVLTLTQMENWQIEQLMDNQEAQKFAIEQAVTMVKNRGIDGINVDFEYSGDPGQDYRDKFSKFVANLTQRMHQAIPDSQVTVSVYAASVKDPKIYDITAISNNSDGIFMMAYDFAVAGSDNAIPTAPLYGHKSGKYWYDVSTAVEDFLKKMPASKLILGTPWYGYNYAVYEPKVNAETRPYWSWRGQPITQTYAAVQENVTPDTTGWDNDGKVGWKAYYVPETDTWRMVFVEDPKSLGQKYDFAKDKRLLGVGMWALGFDDGKKELWKTLAEKFGNKKITYQHSDREIKYYE